MNGQVKWNVWVRMSVWGPYRPLALYLLRAVMFRTGFPGDASHCQGFLVPVFGPAYARHFPAIDWLYPLFGPPA